MNKQGVMSVFLKVILWIIVFILLLGAASFAWGRIIN